jgi:hypothetical protein
MAIYIHDNTDDEITHHTFLNAYLVSKRAAPANLDPFRTLMGSTATGVNPDLIPTMSFRRPSRRWELTSTRRFPGPMMTLKIPISYRRLQTQRRSTFQRSSKVATASTLRWHSGRIIRRCYESCLASGLQKQCTFKHGRIRLATHRS